MTLPPVVLVHGFATSARQTWVETGWVDLLGDVGRAAVAVDLLGHGDAAKPHDPAAYDRLDEELAESLPEGQVDAIGFSLGGRLLLQVAARHPERFRRLVVAGVGENLFRAHDPSPVADALESAEPPAEPGLRYFHRLGSQPGTDPLALAAVLRRPSNRPMAPGQLATVTVPTLVVLGDLDWAGPADPLLAELPDARLVTLGGVDHFSTPKSMAFVDAVLTFLS